MTSLYVVRRPPLIDIVRELCDTHTNREPYTIHRGATRVIQYHVTTVTPLITQLRAASQPSKSGDPGGSRPAATTAAVRIDAIDTLTRIDHATTTWLRALGHQHSRGPGSTIDCIRTLAALAQANGHHADITTDIRRWWTWARITTGWDTPAWAPANTCPLCGTRGTLRIRLDQHIATCVNDECRSTWDAATIGLLADHIRHENGEDQQAS